MGKIKIAEEIPVKNWEEFEKKLHALQVNKQSYRDFFYRGQPNSELPLESTLARDYEQNFTLEKY